jgi:hypothetical protein
MIRERLPRSKIVAFWHIPWPRPSDYLGCPWGRQLLRAGEMLVDAARLRMGAKGLHEDDQGYWQPDALRLTGLDTAHEAPGWANRIGLRRDGRKWLARTQDARAESKRSGMDMNVSSDGAREPDRPGGVEVGLWPMWPLLHGDLVLALVRELGITVQDSILRRLSRSPDAEIHVSPMSVAWVELHEREYDKHRAEP